MDGLYIPSRGDFKTADKVLRKVDKIYKSDWDTHACRDFWQMLRHGTSIEQDEVCTSFVVDEKECKSFWKQVQISRANYFETYSNIVAALPETIDGAKQALVQGCAWYMAPIASQSVEWLQTDGICLDHIEAGEESTIPLAGGGAFAKRALPKGSVVAPAPVIHLHRGHLDTFTSKDKDDSSNMLWKNQQLLMNYAYGHPSTSLLLFPYSPAVNYINHSPKPNVELQWSYQTIISKVVQLYDR